MADPRRTRMLVSASSRWGAAAFAVAVTSVMLAGCASEQHVNVSEACATVDASGATPVCTELFPGDVALRLPSGTEQSPVGVFASRGEAFLTAEGQNLQLDESVLAEFESDTSYATTVYKAQTRDGAVTDVTPVLTVDADLVMKHVFGGRSLVGTISAWEGELYSLDPTLPVLIQLADTSEDGVVKGTVLNTDSVVTAVDGSCVAALPADTTNPLQDVFTRDVSIQRFPSMHAPFDDELVFTWSDSSSGMGAEFYPSLGLLTGAESMPNSWQVVQHGSPNAGPTMTLRLAASVGQS